MSDDSNKPDPYLELKQHAGPLVLIAMSLIALGFGIKPGAIPLIVGLVWLFFAG